MSTQDNIPESQDEPEGSPIPYDVTEQNLVTEKEATALEQVNNLDHFSTGIYNWHVAACNQCIHALNMPEPQEGDTAYVQISVACDPEHPDFNPETGMRTLAVEEIDAFKAGIAYALSHFEKLPFLFVPTDADGNVVPEYQDVQVEDDEQGLS